MFIQWLDRLTDFLAEKPKLSKISGEEAKHEVFSTGFTADLSQIGFDDVEAKRLGVEKGGVVAIAPDDTGELYLPLQNTSN